MFRKTNSLLLLHFTVLLLKLYILLKMASLTNYPFFDAKLNNQIYVLVSNMNSDINSHHRCSLVKHSANHARGMAHHRTTSNRACSWGITVFRWLKGKDEYIFHFHRFLSPENKDNERNQKPATLTVRELYELCNPSPLNDAWEKGNECSLRSVSEMIMPHSYAAMHSFMKGQFFFTFSALFPPTVRDIYFQIRI